jgi:hypothetical protein
MLLYSIVYLIGSSLSLIYNLEEGNTIKNYNLIKVSILVYFYSRGIITRGPLKFKEIYP